MYKSIPPHGSKGTALLLPDYAAALEAGWGTLAVSRVFDSERIFQLRGCGLRVGILVLKFFLLISHNTFKIRIHGRTAKRSFKV